MLDQSAAGLIAAGGKDSSLIQTLYHLVQGNTICRPGEDLAHHRGGVFVRQQLDTPVIWKVEVI